MSIVKADENLYPLALSYFFVEDRGFPLVLEMFEGTAPTKADLEASDIYEDAETGWIDNSKLETLLASYTLVRRWKINDFSKNIEILGEQTLKFRFSDRPPQDFQENADGKNQVNTGTVTWFLIRSIDTGNTVTHYAFVGSISDLEQGGDMEMGRRALDTNDFIVPSDVIIDIGSLETA